MNNSHRPPSRDPLVMSLLRQGLVDVVRTGRLRFIFADGRDLDLGDQTGPQVVARFTDAQAPWALVLDPDLSLGELFTSGRLVMDQGTVYDLLVLVLQHGDDAPATAFANLMDRLRVGLRRLGAGNDPDRSRRNVGHHYDLDDRMYALFLDPEWQYSCAYFEHAGQSLADAQVAKMRHITAKLAIRGGERTLDIGCGWGGLAGHLAKTTNVGHVHGVTLSQEQFARASAMVVQRGLQDRITFGLEDYRHVTGQFDRIVSVGMFEHVGRAWYETFFQTCAARLSPDGVMLLHTIGVSDAPSLTNPWITKYIFPGGHLPALSEILPAIERAGLMVTDIEVLRLHYAETLNHWRAAFMARRDEARALFDERFCRMWEYYLSMSEAAFRHEGVVVFQIQLTRRVDTLPITRDYLMS